MSSSFSTPKHLITQFHSIIVNFRHSHVVVMQRQQRNVPDWVWWTWRVDVLLMKPMALRRFRLHIRRNILSSYLLIRSSNTRPSFEFRSFWIIIMILASESFRIVSTTKGKRQLYHMTTISLSLSFGFYCFHTNITSFMSIFEQPGFGLFFFIWIFSNLKNY